MTLCSARLVQPALRPESAPLFEPDNESAQEIGIGRTAFRR